jgi:hypothetical protein
MKVNITVEVANAAARDGVLGKTIQSIPYVEQAVSQYA